MVTTNGTGKPSKGGFLLSTGTAWHVTYQTTMKPKTYPCPATGCTYTFTSKKVVREHVMQENDYFLSVLEYMKDSSKYANKLLVPTE
jgi:hypothetical protein